MTTIEFRNALYFKMAKQQGSLQTMLLYKIIHNMVDINAQEYLIPRSPLTRGHPHKFIQLQTKEDVYKNFFPYAIKLWNKLDDHTVHTPSLIII